MKQNQTFTKLKTIFIKYYWIAGIPLLIYGIILSKTSHDDIEQNYKTTVGMVYDSRSIHKQYSKRRYKYKFYYNGNEYTGASIAYISEHVQNGNFYKIEFSYKNPEHSRMVFTTEYIQKQITNSNGNIIDTTYVIKDQELQRKIHNVIKTYKYKNDSIND